MINAEDFEEILGSKRNCKLKSISQEPVKFGPALSITLTFDCEGEDKKVSFTSASSKRETIDFKDPTTILLSEPGSKD